MKTKLKKSLRLFSLVLGFTAINSLLVIDNQAFSQGYIPSCNGTLVEAKNITTPNGTTTLDCGVKGTDRCCLPR